MKTAQSKSKWLLWLIPFRNHALVLSCAINQTHTFPSQGRTWLKAQTQPGCVCMWRSARAKVMEREPLVNKMLDIWYHMTQGCALQVQVHTHTHSYSVNLGSLLTYLFCSPSLSIEQLGAHVLTLYSDHCVCTFPGLTVCRWLPSTFQRYQVGPNKKTRRSLWYCCTH